MISLPFAAPPPPGASNNRVRSFFLRYQPSVSLRSICPCFPECRKFSVFPLGLSESMEWIPEFLILPAATEPLPTLCLRKTIGEKKKGGLEKAGGSARHAGLACSQPLGVCAGRQAAPCWLLTAALRGRWGREIRVIKIRQRIFKLEAKRGCFSNSK